MLVGERHHRPHRRVGRVGHERLAVARSVIADPQAEQLLDQQLRDVAASVEPHVDDEALADHLDREGAMELRIPTRTHVGDVDIPRPSVGGLVHRGTICLDPIAVAQDRLGAERLDGHLALLASSALHGELDGPSGPVGERLARTELLVEPPAIDGEQSIPLRHVDARR